MKHFVSFAWKSYPALLDEERIVFHPSFLFLIPLCFLLFPFRWVISWYFAVIIHELCHYLAVRLCGGTVRSVSLGAFLISMDVELVGRKKELLCAAAGPIGSFLLMFAPRMPIVSVCAMLQLIYNLLPVCPMDGGRITQGLFLLVFGTRGIRYYEKTEKIILFLLCIISLYLTMSGFYGLFPICVCVFFLLRNRIVKIPCKHNRKRLQ